MYGVREKALKSDLEVPGKMKMSLVEKVSDKDVGIEFGTCQV